MTVRNDKKWQEMMNRGNGRMEEDDMVLGCVYWDYGKGKR